MKTYKLLFLLLIFIQISCNSQHKKINGISFVASGDSINTSHTKSVIKAQSNYVALMPFGFIRKLSSPKIIHNTNKQWFGETKAGLIQYATEFQKNNIKIMVKPQIWVWGGQYTGLIEMKTEQEWTILENSYTSFIITYAKTAQKLKAEIFCIGTELEKFVLKRPLYWQELIAKIREVYKGKLTYAANWDEFKRVPLWKSLDYIGIDAYFPLSDKKTPEIKDLEKGWMPHKKEILRIQNQYQKKVLFTEYGYRSVDYNAKEPWNYDRTLGEVNLQAQVNGLKVIHKQFWKEDWFAGGFLWKWFYKHEKVGGEKNNMFTPQNKPAEEIIKELHQQNH